MHPKISNSSNKFKCFCYSIYVNISKNKAQSCLPELICVGELCSWSIHQRFSNFSIRYHLSAHEWTAQNHLVPIKFSAIKEEREGQSHSYSWDAKPHPPSYVVFDVKKYWKCNQSTKTLTKVPPIKERAPIPPLLWVFTIKLVCTKCFYARIVASCYQCYQIKWTEKEPILNRCGLWARAWSVNTWGWSQKFQGNRYCQ